MRLALQRFLGAEVPFLQFFPAIMLAAWVGGLGPGLVAVAASAALAVYFFIPPLHDLTISDPADAVSLVLFVATGTGICWLNHRLKGFEEEGRAAANRDRARTQELQNILDTAVDGIIVIDAAAASSRSTGARRAALRLPAGDVLTFHRHAVCKTDRHGAFCRWRPGS